MKQGVKEKAEQLIDAVGLTVALFVVNEIIDALEKYVLQIGLVFRQVDNEKF